MDNKKIVIFGGGTVSHVRNHLALCAPAYGTTAKKLAELAKELLPHLDGELILTKMAGMNSFNGKGIETNEDVERVIDNLIDDDTTKIIIMNVALCDFDGDVLGDGVKGKYGKRLKTAEVSLRRKAEIYKNSAAGTQYVVDSDTAIYIQPARKILSKIRKTRKDIFLVAFKTTCGATEDEQYIAALDLCKKNSCNLVLANDTKTRLNMIVTPEEARYHVTTDRDDVLCNLMEMIALRSHLTFTQSTVVAGDPIPWDSELVPSSLRTIIDFCIDNNAYKPFNGVTAGHFAVKLNDNTFLTSIRKTNFNDLSKNGLVKIVTDGPDTVVAYGAKPSVGGQSQRIVFKDHPGLDCIVHAHVPIKPGSRVPVVSQRAFECGSHACGLNTSNGLKQFDEIWAVYLDNHGPNIVFNRNIDPQKVIKFIEDNFDLSQKTGGFVSIKERLETSSTLETAKKVLT